MENFDGTVRKIITDINAERDKRKSEAESNAMTPETIFGGIGQLIQELQPELAKVLPDLAPEVSLGAWVRRDGVLENTLSLNRVGNHKHIPLLAGVGGGKVKVGENTIRSEDAHGAIIQEIVRFSSAGFLP
jgi:hypothetical protein